MKFSLDELLAPMTIEKLKSWELFWSYQLNSPAKPAHLPQFCGEWAGLAGLLIWHLQNGSQDFDFFNCILSHIYCPLLSYFFFT